MKKKVLGVAIPLATAGLFSAVDSASAAVLFQNGDNLSIGVNFRIDQIKVPPNGNFPVAIFRPQVPGGGDAPVGSQADIEISGVSNFGGLAVTTCNSGTGVSTNCDGLITSFDTDPITPTFKFIDVFGIGPETGNLDYDFFLDPSTIADPNGGSVLKPTDDGIPGGPTAAQCQTNPAQAGCAFTIDFFAEGTVIANISPVPGGDGEVARVFYSYAGPRLLVDPSTIMGSGTEADPFMFGTRPTTGAGNLIIEMIVPGVPEPASVFGILAIGGLLGSGFLKRRVR